MLWNGEARNLLPMITKTVNESRMTEEARENTRAAMVMVGMEADNG
jgi:hypothetical protein